MDAVARGFRKTWPMGQVSSAETFARALGSARARNLAEGTGLLARADMACGTGQTGQPGSPMSQQRQAEVPMSSPQKPWSYRVIMASPTSVHWTKQSNCDSLP